MNSTNIKLVSIILPTYNEKENIVDLIKELEREVKIKKEIIIVDDNSPDGTSNVVKQYIKRYHKTNVKLITRTKNKGLTNSIKDGIKASKGDVIAWMDADFSMPPKILNDLLSKIHEQFDIAVGSRFVKSGGFIIPEDESKDSWLAIVVSRFMNYFIQFCLRENFKDYTSGFIAIRKQVFKKINLRGDYGEYFIDLIFNAKANNFKIAEVPYLQFPRRAGESKTGQNLWQYSKRGIKYIFLTFRLLIEKHTIHQIP